MIYNSETNSECYFPPILGNGDISLAPDFEGMIDYMAEDYEKKGLCAFDGMLARGGRRSNNSKKMMCSRLFSFGKFKFSEGSTPKEWSQELLCEKGRVESRCEYSDGAVLNTECFIHPKYNIYAVSKTVEEPSENNTYEYTFTLEGFDDATKEVETIRYVRTDGDEMIVGFRMYGINVYTGEVRLSMNVPFDAKETENGFVIRYKANKGDTAALFCYLEDNYESKDYLADLRNIKSVIDEKGFDGLKDDTERDFEEFYSIGYVHTDDETLNEIYKTALYNLKCYTTKSSVTIGINNGYWDGRYFAFDEYYSYYALLTSNRMELARRVPTFRTDVCLERAIKYASDCYRNEDTEEMARFFWETDEESYVEMSPVGPWLDHVFHMATAGIGAWEYYEFNHDKEFLSHCYRMIRACAKFFSKYMTYRDGDRLYIGKCTDLERLGAAAENPFMTSCGAIKLLECCADASEVLGIDHDYRAECRHIASKLRESLPRENGMYVPLANCNQKSIAVFAGKYPFNALDSDDEMLINAWKDFEVNGAKYGNMYVCGVGISSWYACWKAEAYARAGMADEARGALEASYSSAGVFNELYEINEPGIHLKPWFTTAGGMFVSSVNEMLMQSDENTVSIMPAYPEKCGDASFRLAVKGGAVADVVVEGQKLKSVRITKNGKDITSDYSILFRGSKV